MENIKDFIIEDVAKDTSGKASYAPKKAKKKDAEATAKTKSEITVLVKDGMDIVYQKIRGSYVWDLAFIPSQGQCYIKNERTRRISRIRDSKISLFASFFEDQPLPDRPSWILKSGLNTTDWQLIQQVFQREELLRFLKYGLFVIRDWVDENGYSAAVARLKNNRWECNTGYGGAVGYSVVKEMSEWLAVKKAPYYYRIFDKMVELEGRDLAATEMTMICLAKTYPYSSIYDFGYFGAFLMLLARKQFGRKCNAGNMGKTIPVDAIIAMMNMLYRNAAGFTYDTARYLIAISDSNIAEKITDWTEYLLWYAKEFMLKPNSMAAGYHTKTILNMYALEGFVLPENAFCLMPDNPSEFYDELDIAHRAETNMRNAYYHSEKMYENVVADVMSSELVEGIKKRLPMNYTIKASALNPRSGVFGYSVFQLIQAGRGTYENGRDRIPRFLYSGQMRMGMDLNAQYVPLLVLDPSDNIVNGFLVDANSNKIVLVNDDSLGTFDALK